MFRRCHQPGGMHQTRPGQGKHGHHLSHTENRSSTNVRLSCVARCEEVGLLPITYPTCFHTDAWPPSSGSSRGRRFDPIPKPGLPDRLTHAHRAHYTQPGSPEPGARWHRVELFPSAVLASELQTSVKKSCLGRCTSGTRRGETDCGSATNCPTSIPDPGVGANAPHRAGRGPTGEARC